MGVVALGIEKVMHGHGSCLVPFIHLFLLQEVGSSEDIRAP